MISALFLSYYLASLGLLAKTRQRGAGNRCHGKADRAEGLSRVKDYAKGFYKSKAWKQCREAYARSRGGLCERCYQRGRYVPGVIVHHKTYITPDTVSDPNIALDWDNLELLCRECHAKEHERVPRRYTVDFIGRVTPEG